MSLRVDRMLELPAFKQLRLIGGRQGLQRTIDHVSVLDVPSTPFLSGGVFILTTFYCLSSDTKAQLDMIQKFADAGVAAVGIHPLVTGPKINDELVEASNRFGVPLILLPSSMPYATVIYAVMEDILGRKSEILKKSEEINRELIDLVIRGGNVQAVAVTLSQMIGKSVWITDDEFELLAVGTVSGDQQADLTTGLAESALLESIAVIKSTNPFRESNDPYVFELIVAGERVKQLAVRAGTAANFYGYIFAWAIESSSHEMDIVAMSHASTAMALALGKQEAVVEASNRYRNDFLSDIVKGKFDSEETLLSHARMMGFNILQKHMVLIANLAGSDESVSTPAEQVLRRRMEARIQAAIHLIIEQYNPKSIVFRTGTAFVSFIHFDRDPGRQQARIQGKKLAEAIQKAMDRDFPEMAVSIGIGDYHPSPLLLTRSYEEAQLSLDVGAKIFSTGNVFAFQDLGVYGVLGRTPKAFLNGFSIGILEQLLQYDTKYHTELVKTVEVFLDEKESFSEAAKRLYVHPNTVKYRMEKIRDILGVDPLEQPEQRLSFHLALKARLLMN